MNGCIIKTFLIVAVLVVLLISFTNIKDFTKESATEKIQSMKTKAIIAKKMIERISDQKSKEKEETQ